MHRLEDIERSDRFFANMRESRGNHSTAHSTVEWSMATPWILATSKDRSKRAMPDEDQIEMLRSLFAHAYEKRQSFLLRLVQAVKDSVGARIPSKPTIQSLNIIEKNKDIAKDLA
jgi:hypothetical protein